MLTEILLEVTNSEIVSLAEETLEEERSLFSLMQNLMHVALLFFFFFRTKDSMYNYYSDNVEKLVSLPADAEAH